MPRFKPATPACAASVFGVLPFLAPRVFAPWPKELGRRNIRTGRRSPRRETLVEAPTAQKVASLEDSKKLAAALGEAGSDEDQFGEWPPPEFTQKDEHSDHQEGQTRARRVAFGKAIGRATGYVSSADYWHGRPELKRRYNELWGTAKSGSSQPGPSRALRAQKYLRLTAFKRPTKNSGTKNERRLASGLRRESFNGEIILHKIAPYDTIRPELKTTLRQESAERKLYWKRRHRYNSPEPVDSPRSGGLTTCRITPEFRKLPDIGIRIRKLTDLDEIQRRINASRPLNLNTPSGQKPVERKVGEKHSRFGIGQRRIGVSKQPKLNTTVCQKSMERKVGEKKVQEKYGQIRIIRQCISTRLEPNTTLGQTPTVRKGGEKRVQEKFPFREILGYKSSEPDDDPQSGRQITRGAKHRITQYTTKRPELNTTSDQKPVVRKVTTQKGHWRRRLTYKSSEPDDDPQSGRQITHGAKHRIRQYTAKRPELNITSNPAKRPELNTTSNQKPAIIRKFTTQQGLWRMSLAYKSSEPDDEPQSERQISHRAKGTYILKREYAVEDKLKLMEERRQMGEQAFVELRRRQQGVKLIRIGSKNPENLLSSNPIDEKLYQELSESDGPRLTQIYNEVEAAAIPIRTQTRFQFVHHLAQKGETETGLKALKTLHDLGIPFTEPLMMQQCATLLQNRFRKELVPPTDFEIFEWMVSLGLQPNSIIYNILMHNSTQRGDRESTYQIYKEMEERGVEPTDVTFSILLNDAKGYRDMDSIRGIFQVATEKNAVNAYLVNDLLHSIYMFQKEANVNSDTKHSPLKPMFDFYRQYFRAQDFLDLIPPDHIPEGLVEGSDPLPTFKNFKMNTATVNLMFIALMQYVHSPQQILDYYRHFQSLVEGKHATICQLTSLDEFYDVFLMAFGRFEQTLGMCTEVLQNMLSLPPHVHSEGPTVRSWSILLQAFMRHQQPRAAEKVLKMMRDRNIEPTRVTWNALIGGYAALQDIQGALDAQERMEAEGWAMDAETETRLNWIRDKDALARMRLAKLGASEHEEEDWDEDFEDNSAGEPISGSQ